MSDDGDDFMVEDDDFEFQYDDDDDVDGGHGDLGSDDDGDASFDLENQYYNAKAKKDDAPEEALTAFQEVVSGQGDEKGEWGFKALKQMIKLTFIMGCTADTTRYYEELLTYTTSAVTRNYSEKSINNLLDYLTPAKDLVFLENIYNRTLAALDAIKNDRLRTKTLLKLAKLWLDQKEFTRLGNVIAQLHAICDVRDENDAGGTHGLAGDGVYSSDSKRGTLLLETASLEIQMYTWQKNNKRLKAVYQQCMQVRSAIPHPRIMGVIRECGGKMYMAEQNWEQAQSDFFEAFKNYDEAGSPQRVACLKYLVLANMLTGSEINPFDSQETKPYQDDPQIAAMTSLHQAYQRKQIHAFEQILQRHQTAILSDPFIREHMVNVLKSVRTRVLLQVISPYTRIGLAYIAQRLNIPQRDVEELVVGLILDDQIHGKIDQVHERLILDPGAATAADPHATGGAALSALDGAAAGHPATLPLGAAGAAGAGATVPGGALPHDAGLADAAGSAATSAGSQQARLAATRSAARAAALDAGALPPAAALSPYMAAIDRWGDALEAMTRTIANKIV